MGRELPLEAARFLTAGADRFEGRARSVPPHRLSNLASARLYGILDLGYVAPGDAVARARELLAGVDVLQLRAKGHGADEVARIARELRGVVADVGVPLIINDHAQVAADVGADGVHLGQDDLPVAGARRLLGAGAIVGKSTHSVAQAVAADEEGADYIGFGPLFATPTKPGRPAIGTGGIAAAHARVQQIPIFCIGGVKLENLPRVIAGGARRVVIVSGILQAPDAVAYMREVKRLLAASGPL